MARNLPDCGDEFPKGKTHLLMDRDTKYTAQFRRAIEFIGIESVVLPPRSPNLNAYQERFMRSIKDEASVA